MRLPPQIIAILMNSPVSNLFKKVYDARETTANNIAKIDVERERLEAKKAELEDEIDEVNLLIEKLKEEEAKKAVLQTNEEILRNLIIEQEAIERALNPLNELKEIFEEMQKEFLEPLLNDIETALEPIRQEISNTWAEALSIEPIKTGFENFCANVAAKMDDTEHAIATGLETAVKSHFELIEQVLNFKQPTPIPQMSETASAASEIAETTPAQNSADRLAALAGSLELSDDSNPLTNEIKPFLIMAAANPEKYEADINQLLDILTSNRLSSGQTLDESARASLSKGAEVVQEQITKHEANSKYTLSDVEEHNNRCNSKIRVAITPSTPSYGKPFPPQPEPSSQALETLKAEAQEREQEELDSEIPTIPIIQSDGIDDELDDPENSSTPRPR